jgi:hypothetical protein
MKRNKSIKWFAGVLLFALLTVVLVTPAQALDIRSGDHIVIAAGEVIDDDMYLIAETVTIEGTVRGDVVAMGSTVTIAEGGEVEGDLIAGGQSIEIYGTVGDDARVAGTAITIGRDSQVADHVMSAGYSLLVDAGSTVGGDLVFAGGQALIAGDLDKNASIATGALRLEGRIGGNLDAEVGDPSTAPPFNPMSFIPNMPPMPSVPAGLTFGPEARVEGDLRYTSNVEAGIPAGAVGGETLRLAPPVEVRAQPKEPTTFEKFIDWFLRLVRRMISLLILGLLIAWLFSAILRKGADNLQAAPWPSLGWGILSYILGYFIVFVILLVTAILTAFLGLITLGGLSRLVAFAGGIGAAGFGLAFYFVVSYLSKILVAFMVGRWILARFSQSASENRFWPVVVGLILFAILWSIPFLGWLVNAAAIFFGLGALWLAYRNRLSFNAPPELTPLPPVE